ncbi:MAG TPA: carboxypeptidase-like regulatory domain-containing protein, partial [Cyclobacteriaceae bacterium]|nr:carboxypeptidase-like regulatory domain-containing protein [Cyclobacteriaceae bacterium]
MRYIGLSVLLLCFFSAFAQNPITIQGKVTDATTKESLPGVNIIVVGTTKGATTNIEGAYTIQLQEGENKLDFSFIGYKTVSITVGDRTTLDVALEQDVQNLEEVVVVGYGVQKKTDITGATASIKGEELTRQPVLTATQAMQGKVAGVQIISSGQPGSSPQIRIRGVGTTLSGT